MCVCVCVCCVCVCVCVFVCAYVNVHAENGSTLCMCCKLQCLLCATVCMSGSNHYGIAGWYAIRAAENGLIVSIL